MQQPDTTIAISNIHADGTVELAGSTYMRDSGGRLVPLANVGPIDKLMDEQVRKIIGFADALSAQISRFKGHTFDDIGSLQALIEQDYATKKGLGGRKGNMTLTSYDGTLKVQVQVQDRLEFGLELQAAKKLVDECLLHWTEDARDELRALVTRAFDVDKEGNINRSEIFRLLRVSIDDERWVRAMEAVHASIRVIGSKTYMRFYRRPSSDHPWSAITIDLAAA